MFALQSGEYKLGPELPPPDDRVRASTSTWALVAEGVRRKYGLERLSAHVPRDAVLSPTTLFPRALEAAALTADERRVAMLFDGQRSIADVRNRPRRMPRLPVTTTDEKTAVAGRTAAAACSQMVPSTGGLWASTTQAVARGTATGLRPAPRVREETRG